MKKVTGESIANFEAFCIVITFQTTETFKLFFCTRLLVCLQGFGGRKPEGRNHLEVPDVDGRIILK
jgi:hypothetical protein